MVLKITKYRIVTSGRRVGEAMMGVSSHQYTHELETMLGEEILETEEQKAYVLLEGDIYYSVRTETGDKKKYQPL